MDAQTPESLAFADKTPLLDEHGRAIEWLDEPTARARIRSGELTVCRTKKKIRALRLRTTPALAASPPKPDPSKWNVFCHPTSPGNSHKETCATNPYGVWAIEPIKRGERRLFGLRAPIVPSSPLPVDDRDNLRRAA